MREGRAVDDSVILAISNDTVVKSAVLTYDNGLEKRDRYKRLDTLVEKFGMSGMSAIMSNIDYVKERISTIH